MAREISAVSGTVTPASGRGAAVGCGLGVIAVISRSSDVVCRGAAESPPDEFIEAKLFGAGDLDGAVQKANPLRRGRPHWRHATLRSHRPRAACSRPLLDLLRQTAGTASAR